MACRRNSAMSHYLNQWWLVYWRIYASLDCFRYFLITWIICAVLHHMYTLFRSPTPGCLFKSLLRLITKRTPKPRIVGLCEVNIYIYICVCVLVCVRYGRMSMLVSPVCSAAYGTVSPDSNACGRAKYSHNLKDTLADWIRTFRLVVTTPFIHQLINGNNRVPLWRLLLEEITEHLFFFDQIYPHFLFSTVSALVQVMAWCRLATSHYPNQSWHQEISLHNTNQVHS